MVDLLGRMSIELLAAVVWSPGKSAFGFTPACDNRRGQAGTVPPVTLLGPRNQCCWRFLMHCHTAQHFLHCPNLLEANFSITCNQKVLSGYTQHSGCLRSTPLVSSVQTPRSDHLDLKESVWSQVSNFTPYLQFPDNYPESVSAWNRHEGIYTCSTILFNKLTKLHFGHFVNGSVS